MASFAPDHPSVLAVRALAPEGSPLAAYLDAARDLPRATKEKIAKAFYPRDREPGRLPGRPPAARRRSRRSSRRPEFADVERLLDAERARARGGARRRPHPRHRAPRGPPHRQPAARPRRPPGRPRLLALLPLARGRPDAHLRLRAHQRPHAAARHGGGRPDRARDGHEVDRARAEAGGGAELRDPQAPARVRRRDEQAAHAPSTTCAAWSSRARTPASTSCGLVDEIVEWYARQLLLGEGQPVELELREPAGGAQGDLRRRAAARRAARARPRRDGVPKLAERVAGPLRGARAR